MLFSHSVLIVLLSIHTMETLPTDNRPADHFQGDMRLTEAQKYLLAYGKPKKQANVSNNLWPNNTVYYRFNGRFSGLQKQLILQAMFEISVKSCINFKRVTTHAEYSQPHLKIQNTQPSCWSDVGYLNTTQELNLDTSCFQLGLIMHELMHTLGFYHQHCASDRDEYVKIHYENILKSEKHNFDKYPNTTDYGVGYDYASIMHYGEKDYANNTELNTIAVLQNTTIKIGQRDGLSPKDILKLNKAYKCNPVEDVAELICVDYKEYQKTINELNALQAQRN